MSIAASNHRKASNGVGTQVAPLLNGDHLTVPEFERRYGAMAGDLRAELVEGIVFLASPVSNDHGEGHGLLVTSLGNYTDETYGVAILVCGSVRLDGKNEYQPDILLRKKSGVQARSKVAADGLIDGAPELVAEIAISSAAYDLHEKKTVYERCGVQEYMVWQVMDAQFHWYALHHGAYVELKARADGVIQSRVFPGLWLDVRAILADERQKVIRVLNKGLKSAAHKTFAKSLKASS